jgi:hypothetical protein
MTEVRSAHPRGSAALDIEALQDLLASSFEVSVGKPRVVRRRALDTFDRRLERAGRQLLLVDEAGEERLELVASEETLVSVLVGTGLRWPSMAGALSDGALKDPVARLAGIRALLVVDERRPPPSCSRPRRAVDLALAAVAILCTKKDGRVVEAAGRAGLPVRSHPGEQFAIAVIGGGELAVAQ